MSHLWSDAVSLVMILAGIGAAKAVWRKVHPGPPAEPASEQRARALALEGRKIQAIAMIREVRGISIEDAKRWAEAVVAE